MKHDKRKKRINFWTAFGGILLYFIFVTVYILT